MSGYITIKLRRGTAAQWSSSNPILSDGEVGLETDTRKFKVGNGSGQWTSLQYWGGAGGGASEFIDLTDVPSSYAGQGGKLVRVKADASGLEFYTLTIAAGDLPTGIDAAKIADGTVSNTEFQYINSLTSNAQTQLNGKVPYTGATANVDLGEYGIKAGQIDLDTSPTGTATVGTTRWNDTIGSIETTLKGGNVILKNGVDLVARIVNKVSPNTTLTKAAYQAVKVSGAQGQRLGVSLAQANDDNNSADTLGLVIETITTNQEGFIMTVGTLEGINTTGSLQSETWADGDILYLSPTTAGRITNIKPTAPNHIIIIGYVEYAHSNNGKIYVKIMNGWELGELHDVDTSESKSTPIDADNLLLQDSADSSIWKKLSWSNVKATLKTYFDTLYQAAGSYLTSANITQVITNGVTTNAPSEDAVFDALAGKQPLATVLTNTTASFTTADETKLDNITITQAVNLDTLETDSHTHSNKAVLDATTASFLTADETKLDGIEALADVTDAGNVGSSIHGATAKTTPVDADTMPLIDSAASNVLKKVTWANIKATLKTYFDTLYQAAGSYLTSANITQVITNGVTDKAPSEDAVFDALAGKQATLVSATNIKTVNGNSLLGSGDLSISGSGGGYDPTYWEYYDHFHHTANISGYNYTISNSGTGSGGASQPSEVDHVGVWRVSCGTTSTGFANLNHVQSTSWFYFNDGAITFEAWVKLPSTLSDGTDNYIVRSGLGQSTSVDGNNGAFFKYNHALNSGNWTFIMRAGGADVLSINTGTAAQANTWVRLKFTIAASTQAAEVFINGTSVGSGTPSSTIGSQLVGLMHQVVKSAGTTTEHFYIDSLYIKQVF